MEDRDRIERLEARLDELESELANVVSTLARLVEGLREGRPEPPPLRRPAPRRRGPGPEPRSGAEPPAVSAAPPPRTTAATRDLEAWIGQNALLVVGVLALVTSVGLALKYAFDQGWISPGVRVVAGLVTGLGVGVYGESLLRRGLRRYGAALVGAGAAIAYAAVWSAAGPFRFVAPAVGIGALLALTVGVFLVSLRHSEEWLAALAAAGAFLAPPLLGRGESPETLLVYAALVAAAGGGAAARRGWRTAFGVVLAGFYLLLLVAGMADANDLALAACLLVVGTGAVAIAHHRAWRGLEVAATVLAWSSLLLAAAGVERGLARWLLAVGPAGLAAIQGWPAIDGHPLDRLLASADRSPRRTAVLELALLGFAAVAWSLVVSIAFGETARGTAAWVLVAVGLAWLVPALLRRSPELAVAGLTALAFAPWRGLAAEFRPAGWAGLALLAVALTRGPGLSLARASGLALVALAVLPLPDLATLRPLADPAFTGTWPSVAATVLLAAVLAAGPAWTEPDPRVRRVGGIPQRAILWTVGTAILLFSVTSEIGVWFRQSGRSSVAAGFTVSAWWLLFSGALLALGFRRDRKALRVGGLLVGGLALLKIVFSDLAFLEALYRVGSFALLAGAALVAARAYHRRAQREGTDAEAGPGPTGGG